MTVSSHPSPTADRQAHWDGAYAQGVHTRSWFQPEAPTSLELLDRLAVAPGDRVIDVGGGASPLVDGLLDRGLTDLTVLDVSPTALTTAQQRLGERAAGVTWLAADILTWIPTSTYDVWHDRAVLHFMSTPDQRQAYRECLESATAPGSRLVIGTFALDGPEFCSGLPVTRYGVDGLAEFVGEQWRLVDSIGHTHHTPSGAAQSFTWVAMVRR